MMMNSKSYHSAKIKIEVEACLYKVIDDDKARKLFSKTSPFSSSSPMKNFPKRLLFSISTISFHNCNFSPQRISSIEGL